MGSNLLLGRVAIITGGGSGIGRAVCSLFAKEGATVIATDINEETAKETIKYIPGIWSPTTCLSIVLDMSNHALKRKNHE